FVSYSHADEKEVYPEIRWLQEQGSGVWFDEGISGATRWRDAIASRLGACRLMVFYVSENSVASQVCREELEFALDRGTPILAVHLEPTELPDGVRLAIANRQALMREQLEPEDYARKLLTAISTHLGRPAPDAPLGGTPWKKKRRLSMGAALALVALTAVLTLLATRTVLAPAGEDAAAARPANAEVVRFSIPLADAGNVRFGDCTNTREPLMKGRYPNRALAFSNDGSMLVFSARDLEVDTQRLFIRRLDSGQISPLPGSEGGYAVLSSPDDQSILTFDGQYARILPVSGGEVEIVGSASSFGCVPFSWTWADASTIYVAGGGRLVRLGRAGTETREIATADPRDGYGEFSGLHALPGGQTLLLHRLPYDRNPANAAVFAFDVETGVSERLITDAMHPLYLARTGHLLFMRRGDLMAAAFDRETVRLLGEPFVAQPGIMQAIGTTNFGYETGIAQLALSADGHLAYVAGGVRPRDVGPLLKVGPDGVAQPIDGVGERSFGSVRVSPDGSRILFRETMSGGTGSKVRIYDVAREVTRDIETSLYSHGWVSWSADGRQIAFDARDESGTFNIYTLRIDGDNEPRRRVSSTSDAFIADWAPDGSLVFLQNGDIWRSPADGEAQPLFASDAVERYARVSPDGRWIAYARSGSQTRQVYVRPFPGPGTATLVSDDGFAPSWSPDGSRLHYLTRGQAMMVVDIDEGSPSRARKMMDWPYGNFAPQDKTDVHPDGSFIVPFVEPEFEDYRTERIEVVLNFATLLEQRSAEASAGD
ncbi:MAG: TIR domain-containing protein, partial [Gammaproteobacteria bacterium]